MQGDLVVVLGEREIDRVPIDGLVRIGSFQSATIRLEEPGVDWMHACIDRGRLVALSDGGTSVNGDVITAHILAHGDRISIGPYIITVEIKESLTITQIGPGVRNVG